MKYVSVTFERSITVPVYIPDDMQYAQVRDLARVLAGNGLHKWDPGPWEAVVGPVRPTDPDVVEEDEDAMVVSDDRSDIVNPEDATWWKFDGASSNR